jgi:tetratricopeptide (TPR) repeat protein
LEKLMAMRALLQRRSFACRRHTAAALLALLLLDLQGCVPASRLALGCYGSTADAHYQCGYFYQFDQRNNQVAIREYSEAIRLKPDYVDALNNRAIAYRATNQLDAAIRDYTAVIREQPKSAFPYSNRAGAYQAAGNRDAVLKDLDTALRIDPTFADAYFIRGDIHRNDGELEDAVQDFTEAIRFYGEAATGPTDRVRDWFDPSSYRSPSPLNSDIRIIDQKLANSYYLRSQAYGVLGEYAKSESDLKEVFSIDPSFFRWRPPEE